MLLVFADSFQEVQQLRYCLCTVSKAVSVSLSGIPTPPWSIALRRSLFDTFGSWCDEGTAPNRYRSEVSKALAVSRMRVKDPESARHLDADISETADMVEQAAYLAMAAMLLVRFSVSAITVHALCQTRTYLITLSITNAVACTTIRGVLHWAVG